MKTENLNRLDAKQKKRLGIAVIILVLVFVGVVAYFIGKPMIRFVSEPEKFRAWVDSHGIWSKLIFIGMVIFQVVVAVIPGELLEIGAGYAFGAVEGTILCVIGLTVGSIIVFKLVRSFGIRFVEIFFSLEKIRSLKFLQNSRRLNIVTFIVFLIPGTPKDLISYFVGLTDIKLSVWIFIASVARLPSVITSTFGGSAIGTRKYIMAAVVFAVTMLISGIGMLIYRALGKHRDEG